MGARLHASIYHLKDCCEDIDRYLDSILIAKT